MTFPELDFTPVGFEPMDAPWWPAMANAMARPWPKEAAMMDLRWWRGQVGATERVAGEMARDGRGRFKVARMPGRPFLRARWGWTDWGVKELLADEEAWRDRWTKAAQDSASVPPANHQPAASEPPAPEPSNADNSQETTSPPPARRQRSASPPPRATPCSTGSPVHRSTDPDLDRGAPDPAADAPPPAQAPDPPPVREPVRVERAPRKPGATADEIVVYGVYRGLHPRKPPMPTPDDARHLRRLLAEAGTVERAGLLLAWVHQADDPYARQLRGEDPWPDGRRKARVDLESLSRHVGARLADAERWEARGRVADVEPLATGPPRAGPRGRPSIDDLLADPTPSHVIDVA